MVLWVLSDLHLGDDTVVPMFHEDRQGETIERLCARIEAERDGELVLLGDVFDLTGMTPPPASVKKFGRKLGVTLEERPIRSPVELCAAARLRHGRTLAALAGLAKHARVTLVPGNHDHALGGPEGRAALDAAGLERARIEPAVVRTLADRTVVMEHGPESAVENASPGGAGDMLTRVMHQAVVPMLDRIDARPNVRIDAQRLVALRPEERMVPVMQRWLTPKQFDAFVDALLDMLVEVGAMSRLKASPATP
ncbi:MAG: hypothetical protein NVS3B10_29490 [Polyangiales bacterium]